MTRETAPRGVQCAAPRSGKAPAFANGSKRLSGAGTPDDGAGLGLYEPGQAAFERVHAGRFKKDVIRAGDWRLPGGRLFRVTPERMDGWVERFREMRAAGHQIPAPLDHSRASRDNLGFVEDVWREGDTLFCQLDVPRSEDESRIGSTLREVSICVEPEFEDSTGKVWKDFISHIAPCTEPVIGGQGDFVRVAAREEGHEIVICRKVGNGMEWMKKVAGLLKLEGEDLSDEKVFGELEKRFGTHTETLRRVKRERDNAQESKRQADEQLVELRRQAEELKQGKDKDTSAAGDPDPRVVELRRELDELHAQKAEAEVEALVANGTLLDKAKPAAVALLSRGRSVKLRRGEEEVAADALVREVIDTLPAGASLDLETRARRTVALRNPNAGEGASEEDKVKAGRSAARSVQGRTGEDD